jgi:hypothetical protein
VIPQVAAEIVALTASDGRIYPAQIVDWARQHPGSALHRHFQWNDDTAAHEYRMWQARQLIAVHVVNSAGDRQTISLVVDRGEGGGYRDLGGVLNNAELRQQAVTQAVAELLRWRDRHRHLTELAGVFRAISRIAPRPVDKDAA